MSEYSYYQFMLLSCYFLHKVEYYNIYKQNNINTKIYWKIFKCETEWGISKQNCSNTWERAKSR